MPPCPRYYGKVLFIILLTFFERAMGSSTQRVSFLKSHLDQSRSNWQEGPKEATLLFGTIHSSANPLWIELSGRKSLMYPVPNRYEILSWETATNKSINGDDNIILYPRYLERTSIEKYSEENFYIYYDRDGSASVFDSGIYLAPRLTFWHPFILNYISEYRMNQLTTSLKSTSLKFVLAIDAKYLVPGMSQNHFLQLIQRIAYIFSNIDHIKNNMLLVLTSSSPRPHDDEFIDINSLQFLRNCGKSLDLKLQNTNLKFETKNLLRKYQELIEALKDFVGRSNKRTMYYYEDDIDFWLKDLIRTLDEVKSVNITSSELNFKGRYIDLFIGRRKFELVKFIKDFRTLIIQQLSDRFRRDGERHALEIAKYERMHNYPHLVKYFKKQLNFFKDFSKRVLSASIISINNELVQWNKEKYEIEDYLGFTSYLESSTGIKMEPIETKLFKSNLSFIMESAENHLNHYNSLINVESNFTVQDPLDIISSNSHFEYDELKLPSWGIGGNYLFPFAYKYSKFIYEEGREINNFTGKNDIILKLNQTLRQKHIEQVTLGEYDREWIPYTFCEEDNIPFFKWKTEGHKNAIDKLLRGERVNFESQLSFLNSSLLVVKYLRLYLRFSVRENKSMTTELRNNLDYFKIRFTHSGKHYFKISEKEDDYGVSRSGIFVLQNWKHSNYYRHKDSFFENRNRDVRYVTIASFSPYTLWSLVIYSQANESPSLVPFIGMDIDLELCGQGKYLKWNERPQRLEDVAKYYTLINVTFV